MQLQMAPGELYFLFSCLLQSILFYHGGAGRCPGFDHFCNHDRGGITKHDSLVPYSALPSSLEIKAAEKRRYGCLEENIFFFSYIVAFSLTDLWSYLDPKAKHKFWLSVIAFYLLWDLVCVLFLFSTFFFMQRNIFETRGWRLSLRELQLVCVQSALVWVSRFSQRTSKITAWTERLSSLKEIYIKFKNKTTSQ